jgi:hypothetical protein
MLVNDSRADPPRPHKLVGKLPITGELLRGSLLERTVRHTKDCPRCARGEGHQVFVLTVTYPGHRTRQFSVREIFFMRNLGSTMPRFDEPIEPMTLGNMRSLDGRRLFATGSLRPS